MYLKISSILTLFLSYWTFTFGQFASISFSNDIVIYKGVESLITASISNYDCNQVFLSSEEGKIQKFSDCYFSFTPKVSGPGKIKAHYINDGDTVLTGILALEIHEPPSPKAEISGNSSGKVDRAFFNTQSSIKGSYFIKGKRWGICSVESFQIIVTRNNQIIFNHFNSNALFDVQTKNKLNKLQSKDVISFVNIKGCKEHGSDNLEPLELIIK